MISRREFLIYCSGIAGISTLSFGSTSDRELRYLCWDGYDQVDLLAPFEKQYNCNIRPEIISDSPAAYARLSQEGHRQYDIVSMDSPWLDRLDQYGLLSPLPHNPLNTLQKYYYPEFSELFFDNDGSSSNWLPTQWGWIGPTINTDFVKESDYHSYAPCFAKKNRGKIGIMDWGDWPMLPIALYLGINPYQPLDDYAIKHLQDAFHALFMNQPIFVANVAIGQKALLDGSARTLIGTGTYLTSAMRRAGLKQIKTTIPRVRNGMPQCIIWCEGSGAIRNQPNEALSQQWVNYMATEHSTFLLSFHGPTCNFSPFQTAERHYSNLQRDILQLPDLSSLWKNSFAHRPVPSISEMLRVWQTELMRTL